MSTAGRVLVAMIGALAAAFLLHPASMAQATAQGVLAFTHIAVIDVRSGAIERDSTVVVTGNRITSLGPKGKVRPRSGAHVVDGRGKFLIPGLWDMHVHIEPAAEIFAKLYLAEGVTGIRDMRMELDSLLALREKIRSGSILMPRMVASGPALDDLPAQFPFQVKLHVKNAEDARAAVDMLKANGVDFIKVHNFTPRDAFFAIADEAKRQNLTFVGHVPLSVSVPEAVKAGQRSIEHLSEFRVVEECSTREKCDALIALLQQYGTWQCPTLVELRETAQLSAPDENRAKYVPGTVKKFWALNASMLNNLSPEAKSQIKERYRQALPLVGEFQKDGIGILAGTDSPVFVNVVSGFSLHDELALLVEAGLTPLQALQAATLNPARFLGKEADLGTIETGKLADLVVLDANPLDDIHNTTKIRAVVSDGRYFDRKSLDALLAEAEMAAKSMQP